MAEFPGDGELMDIRGIDLGEFRVLVGLFVAAIDGPIAIIIEAIGPFGGINGESECERAEQQASGREYLINSIVHE